MLWAILFILGAAIGSFLNVVVLRYDGDHFLLDAGVIGGRSHCPHCHRTLRWFELLPVASFIAQGGTCRRCGARISIQYPLVELASGLIFVLAPLAAGTGAPAVAALWVLVFEALLAMSVIDMRLGIIPDEINIFLGAIGIFLAIFEAGAAGGAIAPFVGRLLGAGFGGLFFALLIAVTRGKGMGMGDLKLAIPLGFLFGWPNIVIVLVFAFVIGAVAGVLAVAGRKKTMKGTLPFGPFLALGAAIMFFWGAQIVGWYLSLLGAR